MNGWVYGNDIENPGWRGGERHGFGPASSYITLPAKESSLVPLFADAGWVDVWPFDSDPPGDLISGNGFGQRPEMPRVCIKRHNKRYSNVVFLDGHAESVYLPGLWKLKWSNDFKPRDMKIPGLGK